MAYEYPSENNKVNIESVHASLEPFTSLVTEIEKECISAKEYNQLCHLNGLKHAPEPKNNFYKGFKDKYKRVEQVQDSLRVIGNQLQSRKAELEPSNISTIETAIVLVGIMNNWLFKLMVEISAFMSSVLYYITENAQSRVEIDSDYNPFHTATLINEPLQTIMTQLEELDEHMQIWYQANLDKINLNLNKKSTRKILNLGGRSSVVC